MTEKLENTCVDRIAKVVVNWYNKNLTAKWFNLMIFGKIRNLFTINFQASI